MLNKAQRMYIMHDQHLLKLQHEHALYKCTCVGHMYLPVRNSDGWNKLHLLQLSYNWL